MWIYVLLAIAWSGLQVFIFTRVTNKRKAINDFYICSLSPQLMHWGFPPLSPLVQLTFRLCYRYNFGPHANTGGGANASKRCYMALNTNKKNEKEVIADLCGETVCKGDESDACSVLYPIFC